MAAGRPGCRVCRKRAVADRFRFTIKPYGRLGLVWMGGLNFLSATLMILPALLVEMREWRRRAGAAQASAG
jgi:hypothetical protein